MWAMTAPDGDPVGRTAELFTALSNSYDAVGVDFFGPIASELLDRLALAPGESLLDVGCGKGQVLLQAASRLGAESQLMGIDVSTGMLESARTLLDAAGLESVALATMDGQNPDLPDGSFDVISSSLTLFFMPDPGAALRAWRRVLSTGGRAGVTTFAGQDPGWKAVDAVFDPYLPPAMLDARTSGARGPFASDEALAELFRAAGFASVQTWHADIPVTFNDVTHWQAWTMSTGQRAMWAAVPAQQHPEVLALAAERLSDCLGADDRIHVTQTVRTTVAHKKD